MVIRKRRLWYVVLVIGGFMIILFTYNITSYLYSYKSDLKFKQELEDNIIKDDVNFLSIDFLQLQEINNDVVGFIKVENTNISYPIVKSSDNTYYLNHSFTNEKNDAGAIFLDYRNDLDNLSKNTIIYGHGRIDNSMFGSLDNLLEEKWLKNKDNYYIKISTPKNKMIFKIFSVYTIEKESYYLKTYFSNSKYFKTFLETIMKRSIFNFKTNVNTNDKILTLSTCKDNYGKRIVVHAKMIKKEETN